MLVSFLFSPPAGADQTYLRETDAPRALFGEGVTSERKMLELSDAELGGLSSLVGRKVEARKYPYWEVWSTSTDAQQKQLLGYIFVLDVIGQSLPITFAVGVRADGTMQDIQVMVYRETHGDEVREHRFRAQFSGKKLRDPLAVGKDIDAISGATISSRSATYAARKALALAELLRRRARAQ